MSPSSCSAIKPQEITLICEDGIKLAGQRWTVPSGLTAASTSSTNDADADNYDASTLRILCLHGWLDNSATFCRMVPKMMEKILLFSGSNSGIESVDVVAVDLPGHGQSSHKSLDGASAVLADYVYYVYDVLHQLGWKDQDVTLMGHSMGASISLMYAAAFPVQNLILLDSLGPRSAPPSEVAKRLEKHVRARLRGKPPSSIYPDLETAIETRCMTPQVFPGNQYISQETATALVKRASVMQDDDGQLRFLHDQRLHWPSILYVTDDQLRQLYKDVATPKNNTTKPATRTCLLLAADGMPFPADSIESARLLMNANVCRTLKGSHHFHSDPDHVDKVVQAVVDFLTDQFEVKTCV